MQSFVDQIKKVKAEKLSALKQELADQERASLEQLEAEVVALRSELDRLRDSRQLQARSKAEFEANMKKRFAVESYKLELLHMLWQEVTEKHFADEKVLEAWLTDQVGSISGKSGTIEAGASYKMLEKLLKKASGTSKLTLKKSDSLATEPGFVFTADTYTLDARLSHYLSELFAAQQAHLYQVAFK